MGKEIKVALDGLPRFQKGDKKKYIVFIPRDENEAMSIKKKLDKYGWIWGGGEGDRLHDTLTDFIGMYFVLYPYKPCEKTGLGSVYWGVNVEEEEEYFAVDFSLIQEKTVSQQQNSISNCMYTIPSWMKPQGCCPRCRGKLAVLLNDVLSQM